MYRTLLLVIALAGCAPEQGQVSADGDDRARVSVPDKLAPDEDLDPIGRHRQAAGRSTPVVRHALGGQEGEPVWDGLLSNGDDVDADGVPGPPEPPPEPGDTSDTGLP